MTYHTEESARERCVMAGSIEPPNLGDPEPDRDVNYYDWLQWWYRQPKNQEKAREIERRYIKAMLKSPIPAVTRRRGL